MIDLVEGAYYERRDGVRVGPAEFLPGARGRWCWSVGEWTYDSKGKFSFSNNDRDLVKHVSQRKEMVA